MTKKQSLACISVVGVVCLSRLLFNIHLQKLRTLHINSIGGGCGGPYIVANKIKLSWPLSASLADTNQLDVSDAKVFTTRRWNAIKGN